MEPPFSAGGIVRPPYFIGREEELGRLVHALGSLSEHVVVVGQRRMGKSSLLANACDAIEASFRSVRTVFLDCRQITDALSFLDGITGAVLHAHRRKRPVAGWIRLKSRLLKDSLLDILPRVERIGGSVGDVFSAYIEFRERGMEPEQIIDKAFEFLERFSREQQCSHVLVLDEFQELEKLRLPYIFQAFKSHGDRMQHVRFAFSGSSLSLIEKVFLQPDSPLYLMASRIRLLPLDAPTVERFVRQRFSASGLTSTDSAVALFHPRTGGVPYYLQRLGSQAWQAAILGGRKRVDDAMVEGAYRRLLRDLSSEFETRWEHRFGPQQRAILLALARHRPDSREELARVIGRPSQQLSAALSALESALEIQAVERGRYEIADAVFGDWLRDRLGSSERTDEEPPA